MLLAGGPLVLSLVYCALLPNQWEASGRVALRTGSATSLSIDSAEPIAAASLLSAPVQQETLAGVLRSDRLAWRVIQTLKLYDEPAFRGRFATRYPGFHAEAPDAAAEGWLIDRFMRRLRVQAVPRTLLVEVRFRSQSATVSARVVNTLLALYQQQEMEQRLQATTQASDWLSGQLQQLRQKQEADQLKLADFQRSHGLLSAPESLTNGQQSEAQHNSIFEQVDELGRQLVAASAERIEREAEYRAALAGDPETVLAGNPRLQLEAGSFATTLLDQIRTHRSALNEEQAQLSAEHGPNFPRVVEIRQQIADLDRQKQAEDRKLLERFRNAWQTATEREQKIHQALDQSVAAGMKISADAAHYASMRQEATSSHDLYVRLQTNTEEAALAAGARSSSIAIVDPARPPYKPVEPDWLLYPLIALFVGIWLAVVGVYLAEALQPVAAVALVCIVMAASTSAQAPTPSTSGIPTGVSHIPVSEERHAAPDPRTAPVQWDQNAVAQNATPQAMPGRQAAAPIGVGDQLEIAETHTPEFHATVRVGADGSVRLPLIRDVNLLGLDERAAASRVEEALREQGLLLHPRVSVLVISSAGLDVSVLGEVTHPGVYPYTVHHRLLDLISASSGLSPSAGRLVNIFHRDDPHTAHAVVLDPGGKDPGNDHNPELQPGDTLQISRAGLVYVIGDVVRPGGFAVDPAQGLTVVQALSLAWGPAQNAAVGHALLIREQTGGRTITKLDLRRMLRGQIPDQPIRDRDILFVPDSTTRNLLNRSLESAIQSTVGVGIYSALVYSQRY